MSIALPDPELLVKHSKLLYKKLKSHSHEKGTTIRISILVCARPADRLPSPDGGVGCPAEAGRCPPRARSSSDDTCLHSCCRPCVPRRVAARGKAVGVETSRPLAEDKRWPVLAMASHHVGTRGRSRPCSASRRVLVCAASEGDPKAFHTSPQSLIKASGLCRPNVSPASPPWGLPHRPPRPPRLSPLSRSMHGNFLRRQPDAARECWLYTPTRRILLPALSQEKGRPLPFLHSGRGWNLLEAVVECCWRCSQIKSSSPSPPQRIVLSPPIPPLSLEPKHAMKQHLQYKGSAQRLYRRRISRGTGTGNLGAYSRNTLSFAASVFSTLHH